MEGLGISWGRGPRTRKSLRYATHYTKMDQGLSGLNDVDGMGRIKIKKLLKKAAKVAVVGGVLYGGYKLATRPAAAPSAGPTVGGNIITGTTEFLKPIATQAIQKKLNPQRAEPQRDPGFMDAEAAEVGTGPSVKKRVPEWVIPAAIGTIGLLAYTAFRRSK